MSSASSEVRDRSRHATAPVLPSTLAQATRLAHGFGGPWIGSIASALRSHSLDSALHFLAHAVYTLIEADYVRVEFALPSSGATAACHCLIAPESMEFKSRIEVFDSALEPPGYRGLQPPLVLADCTAESGVRILMTAAWACDNPPRLGEDLGRLETFRPLIVLTAEHLGALAPLSMPTRASSIDSPTDPLAHLHDHIGADLLSSRERQVLTALLSGRAPKFIARELQISPGTVRNHVRHIYTKLRVSSRSELLSRVIRSVLRSSIPFEPAATLP